MALNLTLPLTLSSPTLDKSPSFILSPESKLGLALPAAMEGDGDSARFDFNGKTRDSFPANGVVLHLKVI